jgi:hypothetical protein
MKKRTHLEEGREEERRDENMLNSCGESRRE